MWKWLLGVVALGGAAFAVSLAKRSVAPEPVPPVLQEPSRNPFPACVAGSGMVEPVTENVMVGVSEAGLVMKVYVKEGDRVKTGDPLFDIDSRALQSQLPAAQAAVHTAEAQLLRVKAFRRKEEEPGLRARLAEAAASLAEAQRATLQAQATVALNEWTVKKDEATARRLEGVVKGGAWPIEDYERAKFAVQEDLTQVEVSQKAVSLAQAKEKTASAAREAAQADLDLYLAGAWAPDVKAAEAALEEARARVEQFNLDIARRTVRSPLDGVVLRRNLREGEFATATNPLQAESAVLVLGEISTLNVRVDIDEFDAQRFEPGAPAVAFLKGSSREPLQLEFVRVVPYVMPKRQLTNTQREVVDTRVLEVVYKISDPKARVYDGQQVDVYIRAEEKK